MRKTCHTVEPITVIVSDTDGYCDDAVIAFAMEHVNETKDRLFGWSVSDSTRSATRTVMMYRD